MRKLIQAKILGAALLLLFLTTGGRAQTPPPTVSIAKENVSVEQVLKEIERLTNYTFFYNNGDFDLKRIVSVAAVRKPVSEVVRQMLPDCSCRFENRRIILVKDAAPQRQTVKGVVKDEKGAPVIGATVLVTDAGQTRGISTDMNGSFTLTLPALTAEAMLEVSFIGFDTYKSAVGSRTFFDVVLTYAQQSIDEVVVVGYGVQKKANLTGAVATVSQKELKDRPVSNVGRALQGVIPNLNVTLSSGQPGAGATYNIRGTTSPNGGSPLVLIDGVETYPDRINSNDIESITVLKDASSAAIYGARGAFGVILITTKSGKYNEKAEVSYNGYFSVSSPTTSTDYETRGYYSAKIADFFMMATQNTPYTSYTEADYKALWERRNDKTENPARPWVVTDRRNGRQQYVYLANFDWYNYLYDDSRPTWDHNINIKGGTKALSYMVSGRYYQQKGVNRIEPDMFKSYNFRVKLQAEIKPWLTIASNTKFFQSNYKYFRYYDPNAGNYLSQDPIGLAGGNPTLYGYVFDPNTQIDPFGLDCGKKKITAIAPYYPPNDGALGKSKRIFLMPGDKVDRFGNDTGKYLSPKGTPFEMRALPPNNTGKYNVYEVIKPFEVEASTIAPAFGKIGLGTQYKTSVPIKILVKRGILKPV